MISKMLNNWKIANQNFLKRNASRALDQKLC